MAINLVKGQTIDLRKNDKGDSYDLSTVTIGLGWDVRNESSGLLKGLFGGGKAADYDLDAIAFLLNDNDKVVNLGKDNKLIGGDIIFFNSMKHSSGHIWLTGDNRTGAGDGDDEQIVVKLDLLDSRYQKILFVVAIYRGKQNNQHFGMVENAFIRAVDNRGKEIVKFSLSGDATFKDKCSMVFAEVYRKGDTWKFRALGDPHPTDNFIDILKKYIQ